jgi:hypothetical protein
MVFFSVVSSRCHADAVKSWDINPEGFVLMVACMADQKAREVDSNGKKHGEFTSQLCRYPGILTQGTRPKYR